MNLDDVAKKRNKAWEDLEEIITNLVKEHYRLQGKLSYEWIDPELESKIKGRG